MTVFFSDLALQQIDELARYLERYSERRAGRIILRIVDRLDGLDEMPFQGQVIERFGERTVRQLVVDQYVVWYRVLGPDVEVTTVFHGARDTR